MKGLSIEQKARRYDEAIARANEMIKAMTNIGGVAKVDDIQFIFPELKESEDERIRKWIKNELESKYVVDNIVNNVMADKALAWLERQCEKGINGNDREIPFSEQILANSTKTCKDEHTPAENKGMNLVEEEMTPFQKKVFCIVDIAIEEEQGLSNICNELLALAKQEIEQKPAWSEEDRKIFNGIIEAASHHCYLNQKDIDWLKSLKERYTWKPSDEQLRVLDLAIRCGINRGTTEETTLVSLFNDLKKLKDEK